MTINLSKHTSCLLHPVRLAFNSISHNIQTYVAFFINQHERIIHTIICLDIRKLILVLLAKPLIMRICRADWPDEWDDPIIDTVLISPLQVTWLSVWQAIYDQCNIMVKALHYRDNEINRQCPRNDKSLRMFFCNIYNEYTIYSYESYRWYCHDCDCGTSNDSFGDQWTCRRCGQIRIIKCWIAACAPDSPCCTMKLHGFMHNVHNVQPNYKKNRHDEDKKAGHGTQLHENDRNDWNYEKKKQKLIYNWIKMIELIGMM